MGIRINSKAYVLPLLALSVFLTGGSMFGGCSDNLVTPSNSRNQEIPQFVMEWGKRLDVPGRLQMPWAIALGPNGSVYVLDFGLNTVQVYSRTGEFLNKWDVCGTQHIGVSIDRVIVVDDCPENRTNVRMFTLEGTDLGLAPFRHVRGVVGDWNGNLYVSGFYVYEDGPDTISVGPSVWKMSVEGNLRQLSHMETGRLTVDPNNNLYIYNEYNANGKRQVTVSKYDSDGFFISKWSLDEEDVYSITGMAADSDGNVYFAIWGPGEVRKYDGNGAFLVEWTEVSPDHEPLGGAAGIVIDKEDNIYVADRHQGRVVKYAYP